MPYVPTFEIYDVTGLIKATDLQVLNITGWPKDEPSSIEHQNLRGSGSIIVPAGNKPYDITIRGRLAATDYENLVDDFDDLIDAIPANTSLILRIGLSAASDDDIKVMRLREITREDAGNFTRFLYYQLVLRANSWS